MLNPADPGFIAPSNCRENSTNFSGPITILLHLDEKCPMIDIPSRAQNGCSSFYLLLIYLHNWHFLVTSKNKLRKKKTKLLKCTDANNKYN